MIEHLRQSLASAIAEEKSYNVPAFCVRLGLQPGEADEAHRSKFRYAQQRLIGEPTDVVVNAARKFLLERDHFELSEAVAKIDELGAAQVTSLTRRRLLTLFDDSPLATELEHLDFLRQVWPLAEMSAGRDYGSVSMEDFLFQHTVRNDDMTNREILEALGMLKCSKARLFTFLEAVTGPEAQNHDRQGDLVSKINELLIHDGYRLAETGKMSGSPIFKVCPAVKNSPADSVIADSLANFEPDQIAARWQTAMDSREASPGRAITLARTLLEDVCKWIIVEAGENYKESDDLPGLYRQLSKLLNLAPDNHTEQVFKQILGSCQSVVESLGALRNKLGDAHSLGPLRARPLPRHAALAVTLAGGMATFLVETWQARKTENGATKS